MLERNLQMIDQRWPELGARLAASEPLSKARVVRVVEPSLVVEDLQLTSCYDRRSEAHLQASLVPADSPVAQVYGMALGDLPRVLLERSTLQELNVYLLNLSLVRQVLEHFDQSDWLGDARVNLLTADGLTAPKTPFAASPVCLQLAEVSCAGLRDRIVLELSTPEINRRFSAKNRTLQDRLRANEGAVAQDEDVALFFGRIGNKRAVVAAAGPTLSEHYTWLKRERSNLWLIALDASLKPLLEAGIQPDLVLTIDAHEELILPFFADIDPKRLQGTALVYFPLVHPDVLAAWPGTRVCAYARHPLYAELAQRWPRGCLFSSGSVLHPAVDLAVKSGAAEVVLLGADFCFPHNKSHVAGCVVRRDIDASGNAPWVLNGRGEKVPTHLNMRGFLRDLECYIECHPQVRFINGSRDGAAIAGTELLEKSQ